MNYSTGYYFGVILGCVIIGGLIGLIPLFMAKNRGDTKLGIYSLIACIIGQTVGGIVVTIIVCVIAVFAVIKFTSAGVHEKDYFSENLNHTHNSMENDMKAKKTYCPNCGNPIDEQTVYCANCGHKVR